VFRVKKTRQLKLLLDFQLRQSSGNKLPIELRLSVSEFFRASGEAPEVIHWCANIDAFDFAINLQTNEGHEPTDSPEILAIGSNASPTIPWITMTIFN
jgi:hypothetical protein